jgi:anti-sigma B factor antagonist
VERRHTWSVQCVEVGPAVHVAIAGELDATAAGVLKDELLAAWEVYGRPLRLDLAGVTYVDSTALRAMLLAWRELTAAGGSMSVERASPVVRTVLEVTGTAEVLRGVTATEA